MAIISYIKEIKQFIRNNSFSGNAEAITAGAYLKLGFITAFHLMVLAVCMVPVIL